MSELFKRSRSSEVLIPPDGSVSLQDKEFPICEQKRYVSNAVSLESKDSCENLVFTRAIVDVSDFKRKLASLHPEIWQDEHQSKSNVRIIRQGHDSWGINKIVFQFCDDFLLKILDFPYAQDEEWRNLLLPVYAAAGVDESRVVRSLLARMPPGAKIPVHHDTGYWVRYTHRCHLPIVTAKEVHFYVGATDDTLKEYSFDEGRLIELNNQAKHAVENRSTSCDRVHLIFDYVDDHPLPQRLQLERGELLNQTRRSIDLVREAERLKYRSFLPSFVILGAQKCGTTSLYEFICQHPLVLRGKCRETHYLDWIYDRGIPEEDIEKHRRNYGSFFNAKTLEKHPSIITGESTPSYLLHSDVVIPRLRRLCPWAKLLVMLRNPVHRAYSQYQMFVDRNCTPEQLKIRRLSKYVKCTFDEAVDEEIAELKQLNITADMPLADFQKKYLQKADELPMNHGGHSIVARGLYYFQLAHWMEEFGESQVKVMTLGQMRRGPEELQRLMGEVFSFLGLPPSEISDLSAKNTRQYSEEMSATAAKKLEEFYAPFNERLFDFLGRTIEDW